MKRKSGASDPTGRPAKSPRVRGKATVNSKKVGGPTFVGPVVAPEFATAKKKLHVPCQNHGKFEVTPGQVCESVFLS